MSEDSSYKKIIKSTGIIGGSQVFTILIGIFRTKIVAVLLGPMGVGLVGLFQVTIDLIRSMTGFGINFSAVKDIAESNNSNNEVKISRTVFIVKRWAIATGVIGMLFAIIFCVPISEYTFGNDDYAIGILFLSITFIATSLSQAQLAILQGYRLMGKMAKATVLGSILGLIITVPLYWWFGLDGIIPGLILMSFSSLIISWIFTKDLKTIPVVMNLQETFKGGLSMARLGFFIVISGFIGSLCTYAIRIFIADEMGISSVGIFQASYTISTMYLSIILNSMLADFFPRLSVHSKDNTKVNTLINEQTELALIFGAPMVIAIIAFCPLIIKLLYSSSFAGAVPILEWQAIGDFFVLITWPLGVLFLAKGMGIYSVLTDLLWAVLYYSLIYLGQDFFGVEILGIGFLIAIVIKLSVVFICVRRISGFTWSRKNRLLIAVYLTLVFFTMINTRLFSGFIFYVNTFFIIGGVVSFSYYQLKKILVLPMIFEKIKIKYFRNKN
ncbi:O-antigen/teichoic acid export membrane protein [Pedobacter sp. CAN_A7]|uniref:O-antigen translocase n=1 Tax=Pedobacter sp. CAN_A7 TaxID=2787722 RepID=UPI0018C8E79C